MSNLSIVNGSIVNGSNSLQSIVYSAEGVIASFSQTIQFVQSAEGTIISIEQEVEATGSGIIASIEQYVTT